MANLAIAQAAASFAPAITQLAAANLQKQQQQQQQQQQLQFQSTNIPFIDPVKELSARLQESRDTDSLRQALQAAMAGVSPAPKASPSPAAFAHGLQQMASLPQAQKQLPVLQKQPPTGIAGANANAPPVRSSAIPSGPLKRQRNDEDKKAGTILLGFLSSLRQSYEEALKEKEGEQQPSQPPLTAGNIRMNAAPRKSRPPQVSDISSGVSSSTGQPESSVEESDWHSDKKTETSSSEDSDKETGESSNKGPPRKRLKTKRATDERRESPLAGKAD